MSDADLFRRYAKEAMHESSKATIHSEKRGLADLACTWAQAALMSDRVFGSSCFVAAEPHFPDFPFGAGNAQSRRCDWGL
jgi:hypothetical protein